MTRYLFIPIFLLFVISCKKTEYHAPIENIVGEYEWYYSYQQIGKTVSQEQISDRYAMVIKNSGKVIYYKNGKKLDVGCVLFLSEDNNTFRFDVSDDSEEGEHRVEREGDFVYERVFPFTGYRNHFIKL